MTDETEPKETGAEREAPTSEVSNNAQASPGSVTAPHIDLQAELQGPSLIDDELTQQLIERGAQDWPAVYVAKFAWLIAFIVPPLFLSGFFSFPFLTTFFTMLFIAWLTGTLMTRRVTLAMRNRHYAKVVRLLPRTLYWGQRCGTRTAQFPHRGY